MTSDNSKPLLTIAIPVFNGECCLAPMLASLDAQDWARFEVRFGDDGSTDGTLRVLAEFAKKHPGRVFIESHENIGPGPSRNRLLAQATGQYIWFCDADDELAPDAIRRIGEILGQTSVDIFAICYGRWTDAPPEARLYLEPVRGTREQLLISVPGATVAKILRTEFLRTGGIGFPECRIGEDFVFTMESCCRCGSALFWYAKPYWVRPRCASQSATVDDRFCEDVLEAIRRMGTVANKFPNYRMEIGLQQYDLASYLVRRLRWESSPDTKKKWLPIAEAVVEAQTRAGDNPLLRLPSSFEKRMRKVIKREQALRNSLSWRATAPLRLLVRFFGHHT